MKQSIDLMNVMVEKNIAAADKVMIKINPNGEESVSLLRLIVFDKGKYLVYYPPKICPYENIPYVNYSHDYFFTNWQDCIIQPIKPTLIRSGVRFSK